MQILRHGRVRRGYLGIAGATMPLARRVARHFELDNTHAVRVESVEKDGPASRAGVKAGDRLVRFGAAPVNGIDDLHRALTSESIGAPRRVSLIRDTELVVIEVTPAETARR
jgi:S1-C subfamily serine protease